MAKYARHSLIASWIGLIVTGLGVVYVAKTLAATKAATKQAAIAAESAAKAVRIAQHDARAWLLCDNIETGAVVPMGGHVFVSGGIRAKNVGRTVASNVTIHMSAVVCHQHHDLREVVRATVETAQSRDIVRHQIVPPNDVELIRMLKPVRVEFVGGESDDRYIYLIVATSYDAIDGVVGITTRAFKSRTKAPAKFNVSDGLGPMLPDDETAHSTT